MFFPLFVKSKRSGKDWNSAFLMGFVFGAAAIMMLLSGFKLEAGFIISCVAGVLIFAGYLGGAVTAAVALALTIALRIWIGGALLPVSVGLLIGLAVAGYLLRRAAPDVNLARFSNRVLVLALAAYLSLELAFIVTATALDLLPPHPAQLLLARLTAGVTSVSLAWLFLRVSWNQSAVLRENSVALDQLRLAFETCGIGVFRYNGETKRLQFDSNFLKLYVVSPEIGLHPGNFAAMQVHPDDRNATQR